jgi:ABC-type transporter Mla subunit MlaD
VSQRNPLWCFFATTLVAFLALFSLTRLTLFILAYEHSSAPKTQQRFVYFKQGGGLLEGHKVRFQGLEVGRVKNLKIVTDTGPYQNGIQAEVHLNQPLKLHQGTVAEVKQSHLAGGTFLELYPGDSKAPLLLPEDPILGEPSPALFSALKELFEENREEFSQLFKDIQTLTEEVQENQGSLQKFLNDSTLREDLQKLSENLSQTFEDEKRGSRPLFLEAFRQELKSLQEQFEQIQSAFNDKDIGSLARLFSPEFGERSERVFEKFSELDPAFSQISQQIQSGPGLLSRFLSSENTSPLVDLFQKVRQEGNVLFEKLETLGDRFSSGNAGFFSAFQDEALRRHFQDLSQNLEELGVLFREGKGSFARLYNDELLLEQAKRCFRQLGEIQQDQQIELPLHSLVGQILSQSAP